MKSHHGAQVPALLITVMFVACGSKEEPVAKGPAPDPGTTPASRPAQAEEKQPESDLPEARPISSEEMKNYLAAMQEIVALGEDVKPSGNTAAELARVAEGLTADGAVGEILARHHFDDLAHFRSVHVSVAAAYAAVVWGEVDLSTHDGLRELEELRPNLTEEQYRKSREAILKTIELERAQGTGSGPNEDVVERNRAALEALFG